MDQIGHSSPTVTLGIYAQVMRTSDETASDCASSSRGAIS